MYVRSLIKLGRYKEAQEQFELELKDDPDNLDAHVGLADAFLGMDQIQSAIDRYQLAITQEADLPTAHLGLACALVRQKREEEAFSHFEKCLAIPGNCQES